MLDQISCFENRGTCSQSVVVKWYENVRRLGTPALYQLKAFIGMSEVSPSTGLVLFTLIAKSLDAKP